MQLGSSKFSNDDSTEIELSIRKQAFPISSTKGNIKLTTDSILAKHWLFAYLRTGKLYDVVDLQLRKQPSSAVISEIKLNSNAFTDEKQYLPA